ncbi:MAG: sugar kinase, partial [Syntrophomonadaceae bacterium]|nr:sugar kinase [Syntrophomonadaceae bacterium]
TGIVSALIDSGMEIESAAAKAAKVNRIAGSFAKPSPATQVYDIIRQIPRALDEVFRNEERG